eukprot:scaffold650891_cov39-Prasinocladus_malaysianus.AAC.1
MTKTIHHMWEDGVKQSATTAPVAAGGAFGTGTPACMAAVKMLNKLWLLRVLGRASMPPCTKLAGSSFVANLST